MNSFAIIAGVVKYGDKILILKRTPKRNTNPEKWEPVQGYIQETESAEDCVLREVKEETGLDGKIAKTGKIIEVTDKYARWITATFLVEVSSDKIKIDSQEHSEFAWIMPKEIEKYDCISGMEIKLKSVGVLK